MRKGSLREGVGGCQIGSNEVWSLLTRVNYSVQICSLVCYCLSLLLLILSACASYPTSVQLVKISACLFAFFLVLFLATTFNPHLKNKQELDHLRLIPDHQSDQKSDHKSDQESDLRPNNFQARSFQVRAFQVRRFQVKAAQVKTMSPSAYDNEENERCAGKVSSWAFSGGHAPRGSTEIASEANELGAVHERVRPRTGDQESGEDDGEGEGEGMEGMEETEEGLGENGAGHHVSERESGKVKYCRGRRCRQDAGEEIVAGEPPAGSCGQGTGYGEKGVSRCCRPWRSGAGLCGGLGPWRCGPKRGGRFGGGGMCGAICEASKGVWCARGRRLMEKTASTSEQVIVELRELRARQPWIVGFLPLLALIAFQLLLLVRFLVLLVFPFLCVAPLLCRLRREASRVSSCGEASGHCDNGSFPARPPCKWAQCALGLGFLITVLIAAGPYFVAMPVYFFAEMMPTAFFSVPIILACLPLAAASAAYTFLAQHLEA